MGFLGSGGLGLLWGRVRFRKRRKAPSQGDAKRLWRLQCRSILIHILVFSLVDVVLFGADESGQIFGDIGSKIKAGLPPMVILLEAEKVYLTAAVGHRDPSLLDLCNRKLMRRNWSGFSTDVKEHDQLA
jgi:hypothetical protein